MKVRQKAPLEAVRFDPTLPRGQWCGVRIGVGLDGKCAFHIPYDELGEQPVLAGNIIVATLEGVLFSYTPEEFAERFEVVSED